MDGKVEPLNNDGGLKGALGINNPNFCNVPAISPDASLSLQQMQETK